MAGKPRNRNRSTARATIAAPSLLTQIIALMMHAPIEEAKRTLDVAHAILDARKSGVGAGQLTQPALPGTTAASSGSSTTTASGAPRRKPGPKPKAVVEGANAAVDAATASATGGQPSPAVPGKGPRRVPPANKLPGAGTRPPVSGADAVAGDGLPVGDAPLPDQGMADDVVEPAGSEVTV